MAHRPHRPPSPERRRLMTKGDEGLIDATDGPWNNMDSAPRDGSPILISFGSDWRSSAIYVDDANDPHPRRQPSLWEAIMTETDIVERLIVPWQATDKPAQHKINMWALERRQAGAGPPARTAAQCRALGTQRRSLSGSQSRPLHETAVYLPWWPGACGKPFRTRWFAVGAR